jgi:MFS-type transporter involved in bile tolerance (Atg22 family)
MSREQLFTAHVYGVIVYACTYDPVNILKIKFYFYFYFTRHKLKNQLTSAQAQKIYKTTRKRSWSMSHETWILKKFYKDNGSRPFAS